MPGVIRSQDDVRIVLVRPRNPLNIGAAARAMSNFGFQDLVLVAPHAPVWEESRSAPGANTLLRHASLAADVPTAVADRTLILGTSSLARRKPTPSTVPLPQVAALLEMRNGWDRVALLFGSEKTGLSNKDLGCCQWIVRIPTVAECSSMNLGQAVAVCCYELWNLLGNAARSPEETAAAATAEEVARLTAEIERLLCGTGSSLAGPERARLLRLREMLLRWPVRSEDVHLALGILRDLRWRLGEKH